MKRYGNSSFGIVWKKEIGSQYIIKNLCAFFIVLLVFDNLEIFFCLDLDLID